MAEPETEDTSKDVHESRKYEFTHFQGKPSPRTLILHKQAYYKYEKSTE